MSNDIQSTLKGFAANLADNTDAIYKDGAFPIDEVRTLERQLHSIKRDLRLRELTFIPFFIPEITGLTFRYFAGYEDDGSWDWYEGFDGFVGENIFAGHSGPSLSPRLNTLLYNWGFNFVYEMHHPRTINFSDSFQALVASLEHPLRTLFKGYVSKDEEAWNNLWTLMRSTTMTNFNQGCALIEGFVEGDQELRDALIANYEASPLNAQLSFYCNSWWMLLFMDATDEDSEPNLEDILNDEGNCASDFYISYCPPAVSKNVMSQVYKWLHRAMTLNSVDDTLLNKLNEEIARFKEFTS